MSDFSTLYKQYAPDVHRFALYLSGQRADAEDITAETFARVWASPEPIVMATVKGYLFTIARHLFLHGLRKSSRHDALDEDLPDPRMGPAAQAEQDSRLETCTQRITITAGSQSFCAADARSGWNGLRRNCSGARNFSGGREGKDSPRASRSGGR